MPDPTEYSIQATTLSGIADAIREKTGSTEPMAVSSFATEIHSISGGGGDANYEELTTAEYNALTEEEKNNGTIYFVTDAVPGWKGVNPADLSKMVKAETLTSETAKEITSIGGWYCVIALCGTTSVNVYAYMLDSSNTMYISAVNAVNSSTFSRATTAWLYFPEGSKFYARAKFNDSGLATGVSSGVYYAPCIETSIPDDSSNHVYSVNEKVVGTWIDGSTLYEKTYVFGKSDLYDGTVSVDKISGKINIDRISYGVIFIADTFYTHTKSSGQISTPANYSIARTDYPFFVRINVTNDGTANSGYDYLYYEQTYNSADAYNSNDFEIIVTIRYTKAVSS